VSVEILIDAGGSTHRLAEDLAVVLADNLRAFPRDPEHSRRAADKLERALVDARHEPLLFTESEAIQVARAVDVLCTGRPDMPELRALYSALTGQVRGGR
jgi:hypothetical protein